MTSLADNLKNKDNLKSNNDVNENINTTQNICLSSKSNKKFYLPKNYAIISNLIKRIIIDDDDEEDDEDNNNKSNKKEVIPLENVSDDILKKIVNFLKIYHNNPYKDFSRPLSSNDISDFVSKEYVDFLNIENEFLYDLTEAANYMDIPPLLELCCAKLATMIKGKSIEEVKNTFEIELTEEEEEIIRNEHKFYIAEQNENNDKSQCKSE
jgi:S-phase kinase-associated protein 1